MREISHEIYFPLQRAARAMSLSAPPPRQSLAELALALLEHARMEADRGFREDDRIFVMDAAEKAWNAVCQAVDHLMSVHRRAPAVGRDAHAVRSEFLDQIGRYDLAEKYSFFADRLHGIIFYEARVPKTKTEMERLLRQVDDFVRVAAAGT